MSEHEGAQANPGQILQLATSFMVTRHLIAASEVGLFEVLAEGPLALDELSLRLGIPRRTARICADAMVAFGLVDRDGDRYRNGAAAEKFLSGKYPTDLRPFLRLCNQNYATWADFTQAIRLGQGPGFITEMDEEKQRIFSEGVQAVSAGAAQALAATYEFDRHRRLLDLGGGTGSFLLAVMANFPDLECALFELPAVAAIARDRLSARTPVSSVKVFEGNLLTDRIPAGYDAILLANVVHVFSPEQNRVLLEHVHGSAPDDARLLLVDFWTNPTHTEPLFAAVMAGEFLLAGGEGDVYSEDEIRDVLESAGWAVQDRRQVAGAASLIVAQRT